MTDKLCPKCKSEFRYSTVCGYCGKTRKKKKRELSIMDLPYADDYDQEGISKEERRQVIAKSFGNPKKYQTFFVNDPPKITTLSQLENYMYEDRLVSPKTDMVDATKHMVSAVWDTPLKKRKFVPSPEPKPKSTIYARSEGPVWLCWVLAAFAIIIAVVRGLSL